MVIRTLPKDSFHEWMGTRGINESNVEDQVNDAFICINGTYLEKEPPYFNYNHSNVLNLLFDDVEEDGIDTYQGRNSPTKAFTRTQAEEVIEFKKNNPYIQPNNQVIAMLNRVLREDWNNHE